MDHHTEHDSPSDARLWCRGLSKSYPNGFRAVDDLTLDVQDGEFLTLLGPSGSGKSTSLRMLIGLEQPTGGSVGTRTETLSCTRRGVWVPPNRRDFGIVFQSYAIWPHMTVAENVAFPMKVRRRGKEETARAVCEALTLVQMTGFADRRVTALSGGQQQRVAIARALVHSPPVLLLDEPLSNLDTALRREMRQELKELQHRLGVTTVYVTHDQPESFSLSDRIAVMSDGKLRQLGSPQDLYRRPGTRFVAEFVGNSNILLGTADHVDAQRVTVDVGGRPHVVDTAIPVGSGACVLAVKPEYTRVTKDDTGNCLPARLHRADYLGDRWELTCSVGEYRVVAIQHDASGLKPGDDVYVVLPPDEVVPVADDQ